MFHRPTRERSWSACAAGFGAAGSLLLSSSAAAVDPITGWFNGTGDHAYQVQWMPDIDQQWWELPNVGNMYCVPTAGLNMLAFASHWGPGLTDPAPGTWDDDTPAEQDALVADLGLLGAICGTSPTGGTSLSGLVTGLEAFIGNAPYNVISIRRTETWYPTLSMVSIYGAAAGGSPVSIAYGRYDWDFGGPNNMLRLLDRNGGHMVTAQYVLADGSDETFLVRDPSASDSIFSQSSYATRNFTAVQTRTAVSDVNDDGAFTPVTLTSLGVQSNGQMRVMDSIAAVVPVYVGGFQGGAVFVQPITEFGVAPSPSHVELDPNFEIVGVALAPDPSQVFVLADRIGAARTLLAVHSDGRGVQELIANAGAAHALSMDRFGVLRYADGRQIVASAGLRSDGELVQAVESIAPFVIDAMCADDTADATWVFGNGRDAALVAPGGVPVVAGLLLPAVQSAREAARVPQAIAHGVPTAFVLVDTEDGDAVVRVEASEHGGLESTMVLAPIDGFAIASLSVDRRGHLLLGLPDGGVKVAAPDETGAYDLVDDAWYANLPALHGAQVSQSVNNFVAEPNEAVAWRNLDPSELGGPDDVLAADCVHDFDGDALVGINDLVLVLAAWGEAGVTDVVPAPGGNGTTDLNDLLAVLAAWGPCS